jgi:hypothetical protein
MTNIEPRHGLPYISAEIEYRGQQVKIENVLLDIGSAACFSCSPGRTIKA